MFSKYFYKKNLEMLRTTENLAKEEYSNGDYYAARTQISWALGALRRAKKHATNLGLDDKILQNLESRYDPLKNLQDKTQEKINEELLTRKRGSFLD